MATAVLIGLNGYKGSGKNTAAKFISEWGARRDACVVERGFADILKLSAARSLGLVSATNINDAVVLMDSLKDVGAIDISIPGQSLMKSITGREYLKYFGTEGHRDVFGSDFWVDNLLPLSNWDLEWFYFMGGVKEIDIAVVTDVRFVNEAERIHQLGGVVWNIDRGMQGEDHLSEQPLPTRLIDEVVDNRTTLEALETNIRTLMTINYHMRFLQEGPLDTLS